MEGENTDYIEGNGDDFLKFIFSTEPRAINSVKLELDPPKDGIKIGLHIFQELLMVFTMALKFLYSDNEVLNISSINQEDIEKINKHFQSFGHILCLEKFTIHDYLSNMKLPNYFKDKHLIQDNTLLKDIYYESYVNDSIYRISFDFLR